MNRRQTDGCIVLMKVGNAARGKAREGCTLQPLKINSIRLSGGLARINLISQIKAGITERKVQALSEFRC